ncbi:MAG TPA: DUF1330 domain-containing protein [Pseudonocardiaceae bacterium]|jgi:uncharacterized protein (DUF1330 family)|nr:DUF1330 domain-containing protein [Pseudonocardiaceae bacterium]
MAKGYWVTAYREIVDPDKMAAYSKVAAPALAAAGGRFLVRGGQSTPKEAGLAERTVVVEFDSYDAALAAYESEGYQQALAVFDGAAVRDLRIIEGAE